MGTGYTRQSAADIITGANITAAPLNAEFNAIQAAFNSSSGHSHDGTSGEGPLIDLTTSITGLLPAANGGFSAIHKVDATTAPTANEDSGDGYGPGSVWVDVTNDVAYVCLDGTATAAVWRQISFESTLADIEDLLPTDGNIIVGDGSNWVAESGATARASLGLTIDTDVQSVLAEGPFADGDKTKLDGIEASADVTDTTNVTAAGALMDSEVSSLSGIKTLTVPDSTTISSFGASLIDDASASAARTTLGLGSLATLSSISVSNIAGSALVTEAEGLASSDNDTSIPTTAAVIDYVAGSGSLLAANNLSDLNNAGTARTNLGVAIGSDVQAYNSQLATISGITPSTNNFLVGNGTTWDLADPAASRSSLGLGNAATAVLSSAGEYRNDTAGRVLTGEIVWDAAEEVTLTDAASIAVDWDSGINFTVTLGGNRTLANGSNEKVGQSGYIRVVQDGTGSRTLSFGTDYEFAGGTAPTLTTTAGATDVLFYTILSATRVLMAPVLDIS